MLQIYKQFWKVAKPLFSDKSISGDKINLTENGEYVKTEIKTAKVFNSFFKNIVATAKWVIKQSVSTD